MKPENYGYSSSSSFFVNWALLGGWREIPGLAQLKYKDNVAELWERICLLSCL